MQANKIRIKLTSFDHKVLDLSAKKIVETAERTGAEVSGPIQQLNVQERRFQDQFHYLLKKK